MKPWLLELMMTLSEMLDEKHGKYDQGDAMTGTICKSWV
jgi:hypothetical protein